MEYKMDGKQAGLPGSNRAYDPKPRLQLIISNILHGWMLTSILFNSYIKDGHDWTE